MDLVRPWIAGAVLWVIASVVGVYAVAVLAPAGHLYASELMPVAWWGAAGAASYALAAMGASLLHRAPERWRAGRNAAAALAAPVVGTAANAALMPLQEAPDWPVFAGWSAIALVGAVAGWALAFALRRAKRPAAG